MKKQLIVFLIVAALLITTVDADAKISKKLKKKSQVALSVATTTTEAITAAGTSFFACSGPSNDALWTYSPSFSTIKCAGTGYTYLGPYGAAGTATSPAFTVADAHQGIVVSLQVAFIDSWDGEAFKISADGALVYSQTHEYATQSSSNTCQNGWNDAYASVTFGFNHTASTLTLVITSALDQAASDEAWGVCNLVVSSSPYPVNSDGSAIKSLSASGATWFACSGPANDNLWTYSPSFSTINCAGTGYTYLGPYGAAGTATSPKFSVGAHQGIIISFKLAFIDSWDGEAFKISADGTLVYSQTHEYATQSSSNTCQNGWNDAYASVTFGFNHTASTLTLVITSVLDQAASDEAWGVCDFNIQSSPYQANADGSVITVEYVTSSGATWFACCGPVDDALWTYSPSFSTINCAGTGYTYLGPYGAAGTATSPKFSVGAHQGIIISFKLAFIDSWDGEAFKISADGTLVYSQTHEYATQSSSNTCQNGWNDAYASVTFGFNHTASTLTLVITSALDQAASDEAWGVCDFNIQSSPYQVNADGSVITVEYVTSSGATWFACSGPVDDALWTYSPSFSTINCAGTGYTYLGPYGAAGTATSPKFSVGAHQGIVISFKLAFIDSWDGEAFKISADGTLVYSQTHEYATQSSSNTCQNGWNDAYANVTFGFNHTASTLTLVITSGLDQDSSDEAWGICDFNIQSSQYQANADGSLIIVEYITALGSTWFACSGPANDNLWTYSPSFSTIKCAGTGYTYLGPYGAAGTATSPKFSVGAHQGIVISFQLAFIDSWDGEAFKISADGTLVYSQTHEYATQSSSNTCQNGWNDAYASVTFGFNHTASTLTLVITSALDQASSDEAWGVCNFNIQSSPYQVNADGSIVKQEPINTTSTTWFACSGPANDGFWTYSPSFSTINCAGTGYTYLGPYGAGGTATSPTLTVGTHQGIVISFRLAFIDSWDGEAFKISADGTLVYSQTHEYATQSSSNTCQNGWNDAYASVTFGFNHTASTLTLVITSALDQASSDEAWGICNFTVTASQYPVSSSGAVLLSYFPCSGPSNDATWTYSPSFSTINCAGTGYSYLGPYGAGGKATSPAIQLPSHQGVSVSVQVAFIDSWDGEAFKISADNVLVFSQTHEYLTQSSTNSCQSTAWPDAYASAVFGFNHTASTLTIGVTSALDQASSDEAWGICNLNLQIQSCPVLASGTAIVC